MTPTVTDADIAAARARLPGAFRASTPNRVLRLIVWVSFVALFLWCLYAFDITPGRLWTGLGRLGSVLAFMFPPHVWTSWAEFAPILKGLTETLSMAFMGTLLGAVAAFPLSFLGARNITRFWPLRMAARRGFDIIRAFDLGPLAGVLAIAVAEVGVFAKLFSEAIENASERPVEGVKASGGSRLQTIRFGVIPQVAPVILSIILYNFESNVRSGTILGIVGAGGIGFILSDRISAYRWDEAWSIIFLIIAMVYLIDWLSGLIRSRLIGTWDGVR